MDEKFLKMTLLEAQKGLGTTSPNPAVGAVIVKNGKVIAKGFHKRAGAPHAEVIALQKAGDSAKGSTLYCSLEPCNHHGRTPPCTEAIIAAGVKRVVFGFKDPNPCVAGGGAKRLQTAGITAETGLLSDKFDRFYRPYAKYASNGRPYVTLKAAITMDGRMATSSGDSQWISSEASRLLVHRQRAESDVILTGIGTVIADDPQLTARVKITPYRTPLRVVVDSKLAIPENSRIISSAKEFKTMIATTAEASAKKIKRLEAAGADVAIIPETEGRVSLEKLLGLIGAKGFMTAFIEAGPTLLGELARGGFVDEYWLIVAPKLTLGGDGLPLFAGKGVERIAEALNLEVFKALTVGGDYHFFAYPRRGENRNNDVR